MLVRGSLKKCISGAIVHFNLGNQNLLSIIRCDRGKYYSLLTEEDLTRWNDRPIKSGMRLTFRGTARELIQFANIVQPDLFKESDKDEGTQNNISG